MFLFKDSGYHLDLHLLTHFPTRRSSDLAIAGEGVAVTGIDDQRAARAALHLLAAEFDLGRAADIAREHARDRRAGRQLDIGEVAAVPFLVARARDAERDPGDGRKGGEGRGRSEEHTSELQSLMRISYAVFCLKKNKKHTTTKSVTINC